MTIIATLMLLCAADDYTYYPWATPPAIKTPSMEEIVYERALSGERVTVYSGVPAKSDGVKLDIPNRAPGIYVYWSDKGEVYRAIKEDKPPATPFTRPDKTQSGASAAIGARSAAKRQSTFRGAGAIGDSIGHQVAIIRIPMVSTGGGITRSC